DQVGVAVGQYPLGRGGHIDPVRGAERNPQHPRFLQFLRHPGIPCARDAGGNGGDPR
ncbi:hypothetical protein NGA_2072100, partial [Nannochloropsis gaditana CCMP526]|uniref:uncharacterized protein n=1 Tax=Nannochloropsis gaditana (strain CCMP526) TaxID=1093141 RepID=UPI00029F7280